MENKNNCSGQKPPLHPFPVCSQSVPVSRRSPIRAFAIWAFAIWAFAIWSPSEFPRTNANLNVFVRWVPVKLRKKSYTEIVPQQEKPPSKTEPVPEPLFRQLNNQQKIRFTRAHPRFVRTRDPPFDSLSVY